MRRLLLYPFASVILLAGEPAVGATLDALPTPRNIQVGSLQELPRWVAIAVKAVESPPPLPSGTASAGDRVWSDRDSHAADRVTDMASPRAPQASLPR